MRHIQNMAKIMLATGLIVFYGYTVEAFMAWYSASSWEGFMIVEPRHAARTGGRTATLIFCNGVIPQTLWFKRVRMNVPLLFLISLIVNVGMWLERYVIIVTSLEPRLPAVRVGDVFRNDVGLGDVRGHARPVRLAAVPVHPLRADDLDFRDADDRPRRGGDEHEGALRTPWHTWKSAPSHYGLMAEFPSASALVAAARRAREAGYTKIDAYSPFPIEELNEALKLPRNRVPLVVLLGWAARARGWLRAGVLGVGDRVSAQHRRPAVPLDARRSSCRRTRRRFCLRRWPRSSG